MFKPNFIHLHVHSDYSMIDGLAKVDLLVRKAASMKMPALAITDFTNLCGLIKFYCSAHSLGIKPIIGVDFLVQNEMLDSELTELTILAANNLGYRNLILLISDAYKRGYSKFGPIIDHKWLINHNEGLILLSGAKHGDVGKYLMRGKMLQVEKCLEFYNRYFQDRYYVELIRTGRVNEENYLRTVVDLAKYRDLPVVATNDVRFINIDDFDAHEVRVAIHDGFTLNDIKRPRKYSKQQYMRSEEEMCKLFADIPEALINSVEIARRCNVNIQLGNYYLPQFPTGKISTEDYLIKCAREGLEERLVFLFPDNNTRYDQKSIYYKRLNTELQVINQMGFPGYFLIVMEFVQWSKNNNIPVGPGRGSGTGSLVAYALKITDIDPLSFNLLFERFLNPERISMPDFDIDFCMEKRDLVIDHVAEVYGIDAVSQIITFGTMTAKAVIRDVGRVLGYPYSFVERISKLIPSDPGMTLKKAFVIEQQLQIIYDNNKEIKLLVNMARKLEGVIRNFSKHAGGVLISPTKITDFMPLYCDSEGSNQVTQFDKNDVEYIGLVKFDFLGLRTLTIISHALKMININRTRQNLKPIDIKTISLKDKKSFDLLKSSETKAIFQLESRGMKELIKRLQPDCFEDIIALVALFRPGPLQSGMVDNFINRKHGREIISYPDKKWQHPLLIPILKSTYGIILYQEQVMQIAQILAGYTLGCADILRRAMGKKKPEEMAQQRLIFKTGAESIGVDGKLSMKIFNLVEKFAGYGFNKSHSTAYALVSYQTLWLKAHYPAEFMAAVMTADMDNTEKIVELVDECLRIGLKVLPPNINSSQYNFYVNKYNEIVYGMGAIKGVGKSHVKAIIEARNQGGHFRELSDFCVRTDKKILNRRVLERLIMSGAFDCLGSHRAVMINSVDNAIKTANQNAKAVGQIDMFGKLTEKQKITETSSYKITPPWPEKVITDGERETLGFYLTRHPITQYLREIEYYTGGIKLKDIFLTHNNFSNKIINVAGLVLSIRLKLNKQGNQINICTIDDHSGRLDLVLSNNIIKKYQYLIEKGRILIVQGQVNFNYFNHKYQMITYKLMDISELRKKYARGINIFLNDKQINDKFLNHLNLLLKPYRSGKTIPIHLFYQKKDVSTRFNLGLDWKVIPTNCLLSELRTLVGNEQVELEF